MSELDRAKSRLVDATTTTAQHRDLVVAMRCDVIAACVGAHRVARVVIVTDEPTTRALTRNRRVTIIADPSERGLNAALRSGESYARRWPSDGVLGLVSDLPCLSADVLDAVLDEASHSARAVVVDRDGTGTTMLTCLPGTQLQPQFGPGSADRHRRSGAVALDVVAAARCDVDRARDLDAAVSIGLGPATAAALARAGRPPSQLHREAATNALQTF